MFIAVIVLLNAIAISAIAAYYSIAGLMAIFSGAATTIAVMGSALEIGKLVTASWLYHFWDRAPILLRAYLTIAVVVLMFITSMGIFGYLSRAHLAQVGPAGEAKAQIEKIDFDVAQHQKRIDSARHILKQFDDALQKYYEMEYVTRALREREVQKPEREALQATIDEANAQIEKLTAKRFEAERTLRGIEVEVGPIKYIAEMIYGGQANDFIDEAVRAVIVILIFVFDPLAVLLVIAGNMSIRMASEARQERKARKSMAPAADKKSEPPAEKKGKRAAKKKAKKPEREQEAARESEPPQEDEEEEEDERPARRSRAEQPEEPDEEEEDDEARNEDEGSDDELDERFDSLIAEEPKEQEPKEEVLTAAMIGRKETLSEEEGKAKKKILKLVKPVDLDEEKGEQLMERVEEASAAGDYTLERIFGEIVTEMGDKGTRGANDKGSAKKKSGSKKSGR